MAENVKVTEKPLAPNELGYRSPYEFCSKCDRFIDPDTHQHFRNTSCYYRLRHMDKKIEPFLW